LCYLEPGFTIDLQEKTDPDIAGQHSRHPGPIGRQTHNLVLGISRKPLHVP
jgi:hypothetical protein